MMNQAQNSIQNIKSDGGPPGAALAFCFLLLRGGRASAEELIADSLEWILQHGECTYASVERWAETITDELEIVKPLLTRRLESGDDWETGNTCGT